MTKRHAQQLLYVIEALLCALAPTGLSPVVIGLSLALINLAFALWT
jgi:hypothetical protein